MYYIQDQLYSSLSEVPEAYLSVFKFQDALIETLKVKQGKIIFWEEHYFRLMASMRVLRMQIPLSFTMEKLEESLHQLLEAQEEEAFNGDVIFRVFKANVPTYQAPVPKTLLSIQTLSNTYQFSIKHDRLPIDLYKDHYWTSGLYSSLENVHHQWESMAWTFVYENDFCDGIILNEQKQLVGTLRGNIFLINGTTVSTPSSSQGCKKNVYRSALMKCIETSPDWELSEGEISPFALQKAEELFVLEGHKGIYAIGQYRKKRFTSEKTQALMQLMSESILSQT
ncbi:MAG: aminotransferase class IV [Flavobacteriaceae bacterium]